MSELFWVYVIVAGLGFTASSIVAVSGYLLGEHEEAKVAARVSLASLIWPAAFLVFLFWAAFRKIDD